jgi:hypothetical protein
MGKPFGKRVNDWLQLLTTTSFLKILLNTRKSGNSDYQPVITIRGNPASGGGTWFHEDVAIEYARWLSDDFKIWCNDKMIVLMKTGLICNISPGFISGYLNKTGKYPVRNIAFNHCIF